MIIIPNKLSAEIRVSVEVENMPKSLSGYYAVAFDSHPGIFLGKFGNVLKVKVPQYADMSSTPSLTVHLGGQECVIPNAFHLAKYWETLDKKYAMTGGPCRFVEANGEHYVLFQDQTSSSLKKFNYVSEEWLQVSRTDVFNDAWMLTSFSLNGDLYFIARGSSGTNINYKYSTDTGDWTKISDFPLSLESVGYLYSFSINNKAYAGCIYGFYSYDGGSDKWIQEETLPTTHYEIKNPLNFSSSEFGFVGFMNGHVNKVEYNEFWQYNTLTEEWVNKGRAPINVYSGGSVVVKDNIAYMVGLGYQVSGEFISYDLTTYKVQTFMSPPTSWSRDYTLFEENDFIYFMVRHNYNDGWEIHKIRTSKLIDIIKN